ncbi:MAG: TonB family protein [Chitinispirillaceae bacterium]|nr:TonB family protein [Chitinispirillaceae bacterium]
MAPVTSPSGIFFKSHFGPIGRFPKKLRRSPLSRLEPRFTGLFGALMLGIGVTIFMLSNVNIKEEVYSEKAMQKIQERYAQLVLNQPKPKAEEVEEKEVARIEKKSGEGKALAEDRKKEEATVDRAKESFVQREQRREATREVREKVREQVKQQVMSSGIFAAITATSGTGGKGGGGPKVSDLLGTATADLGEIGSISITKGAFATKNVDAASLSARKTERVSGVSIEKQEVGRATVTQVASAGAVNITSRPPEISGESSTIEERSQAAIGRIVTRETQRLKRVYEDWLKRDPQLAGHLTVKFTILPSGTVSNASVVKSTTNNGDFDEAVLRYIKRWQFPAVEGASPVEVVYPFVFEGNPG